MSDIIRGPSPGGGRNAWVYYNGLVWTVGMPGAKKTAGMDIKAQTELALAQIDERLAQAGTDKSRILEATVFITSMDDFKGMDAAWQAWCGDDTGVGASRATVCVSELAGKDLVEIKCTVAAAP